MTQVNRAKKPARVQDRQKAAPTPKNSRNNPLVKLGLFAYKHAKITFIVWLAVVLAGTAAYTTWLNREGFPTIQVPIAIANGTYFVNDADQIDEEITQPISEILNEEESITEVQTTASGNFFTVIATFEEGVQSEAASEFLEEAIDSADILPPQAEINYPVIDPGKYLNEYEILTSVYATDSQTIEELEEQANRVADELGSIGAINEAEVISQFSRGVNPLTGESQTQRTEFSKIGIKSGSELEFHESVTVGVKSAEGYDIIELSNEVRDAVENINSENSFDQIGVVVTADFAPSIETQINSLQENLFTGLVAVAVVSLLLITWRASLITAIFMVSVMLATLLILELIGYSLNTISLFALVLALGLFVDDATIIVEAIDAGRKKGKKQVEIIRDAVRKVAGASFAGTTTTVLVFLPLVFVSGVLGEFIRILPLTIIIALVTSLFLSLTLIPFLSKFILLKNGFRSMRTPITTAEKWLALKLAKIPLIARKNRKKAYAVFVSLMLLPLIMIGVSGYFASQLTFNIFPPSKDADQLQLQIRYPDGTGISGAVEIADETNQIIDREIGGQVERIAYFESNERSALAFIELVPFTERDVKSPELLDRLDRAFSEFDQASVRFGQIDAGPPAEEFPFKVQVFDQSREQSLEIAKDIEKFLSGRTVERQNGTTARISSTNIAYVNEIARKDGSEFVEVQAGFEAEDTSALVEAAQTEVEKAFGAERLADSGLAEDALEFDFGQESENQESFNSLAIVGPLSLLAMFVLLAIQFRSLLQPILIFMAIPFSFFGVMYGLYVTDNPISFFVMIGFFGLIGIAVNNTILLTDYANQEQRAGRPLVESIAAATFKRFRPLLATSLTTVAALLPLALSDPFWEALAFTIIFGLLSSTLLVLMSFPYYYLAEEVFRRWLRRVFSRIVH